MRAEKERLQKISALNSFQNSDFALDTLFQHVQNTQIAKAQSNSKKWPSKNESKAWMTYYYLNSYLLISIKTYLFFKALKFNRNSTIFAPQNSMNFQDWSRFVRAYSLSSVVRKRTCKLNRFSLVIIVDMALLHLCRASASTFPLASSRARTKHPGLSSPICSLTWSSERASRPEYLFMMNCLNTSILLVLTIRLFIYGTRLIMPSWATLKMHSAAPWF